jgi:hypothetical protein
MLDCLAAHYDDASNHSLRYRRSWRCRIMIIVYREQYSDNMYRKGYGPDWKSYIKEDVEEYLSKGRLPLVALKVGAKYMREVEMQTWVFAKAQRNVAKDRRHSPQLSAVAA